MSRPKFILAHRPDPTRRTIENLKWHLASLRDSDWSKMHHEDVIQYGETMVALVEVLAYFGKDDV